jgi:hypothetical protein
MMTMAWRESFYSARIRIVGQAGWMGLPLVYPAWQAFYRRILVFG